MILEGYISKIIYHNDDNAYTVFVVEKDDGDETAVGYIPGIAEGMYIQAEGEYVDHQQYSLQFNVQSFELSMPSDVEGIVRFLGSGIVKGIGEVMAKRIVKKFGEDTLRVMEEEPERLAEVKGISERIANKIAVSYLENKAYRSVIIFLSKYGIGINLAMKIYSEFGDGIYEVIKRNPYEIADRVPGVGFKIVDKIALNAGILADSDERVEAAILYILGHIMSYGHIFYPMELLEKEIYAMIMPESDESVFGERVNSIISKMEIDKKLFIDDDKVYTRWNYFMELDSAKRLLELKLDLDVDELEIDEAILRVEKDINIKLAEEQKAAVINAVSSAVSIITGGPGTGKTTIINAIIKYYEYRGEKLELAAPTGRAAKRITESTGYKARTIHRLLEFSGEPTDEGGPSIGFQRNAYNPLECDVVIIDEASMLDASLFHSLLKAIPKGCRLVLVGDTDQLPSVGAGNVLHDIIESQCFPVSTLDRNFRQRDDSRIITNAHKIKRGEHLEISNAANDFFFIQHRNSRDVANECSVLVNHDLPKYLGISPLDIEVLTPTRQYDLGVEALNKKLQADINPPSSGKREKKRGDIIFREGDKVMQIRNNYKLEWKIFTGSNRSGILDQGVGVFNGDMGIISEVNDFDECIIVSFDDGRIVEYDYSQLDELEHAFAITIHKSQGSEYPAVVIPVFHANEKLLTRNLLYTAVTRAKRMVVMVGNISIVNHMIDNAYEQRRFTTFKERLMEFADTKEHDEYMSLYDEDVEYEGLRE